MLPINSQLNRLKVIFLKISVRNMAFAKKECTRKANFWSDYELYQIWWSEMSKQIYEFITIKLKNTLNFIRGKRKEKHRDQLF